jgi:hypothetical protein
MRRPAGRYDHSDPFDRPCRFVIHRASCTYSGHRGRPCSVQSQATPDQTLFVRQDMARDASMQPFASGLGAEPERRDECEFR